MCALASAPSSSSPIGAYQRLKRDFVQIVNNPVPYIIAAPLPDNILEWHYVVQGPPDSPYEGGFYHGRLVFPTEYPFKPPSIFILTPNGRFETNKRLCFSMSDYHPESWNPSWNVSTILLAVLSFMLESTPTLGSVQSSDAEKRILAKESMAFNMKQTVFRELFSELCKDADCDEVIVRM